MDTKKAEAPPPPPPAPKAAAAPATKPAAGTVIAKVSKADFEPLEEFGDMIPYADPSWYQTVRTTIHCTHLERIANRL